jgi:hypothetical protein
MNSDRAAMLMAAVLAVSLSPPSAAKEEAGRPATVEDLRARLVRAEAVPAVERLQYALGYYQDRFLFDQIPALFVDEGAEVHYRGGVWLGQAGAKRFWQGYFSRAFANGKSGPQAGRMFDMPQWQGIVTVDAAGKSARGRFRTLGQYAVYREREEMVAGFYENGFRVEGGKWKLAKFQFCQTWSAPYTEGWQEIVPGADPSWKLFPADPAGPDRLATPSEQCAPGYPVGTPRSPHFAGTDVGRSISEIAP